MKAVVYDKGNAPASLVMHDVVKPVCTRHEVLVKTEAVSINAADYCSMQLGIVSFYHTLLQISRSRSFLIKFNRITGWS
jgi:NADPH:quinone reductase-like Zn-dependent oxidoreductase